MKYLYVYESYTFITTIELVIIINIIRLYVSERPSEKQNHPTTLTSRPRSLAQQTKYSLRAYDGYLSWK